MARPTKNKLSKADERFCQEYIIDLNGTQAYIRAGHNVGVNTAKANAYKMLTNTYVQTRIQQLVAERAKRTEITADKTVRELGRVAFSNMKEYATWDRGSVSLIPSDELTEDQAAAVELVKETERGMLSIKLHNKLGALEALSRHFGLFNDRMHMDIDLKIIGAPKPESIPGDNPNAGINGAGHED